MEADIAGSIKGLTSRECPVCSENKSKSLFTDINRREGLPLSTSVVECWKCGMHYLNPALDTAGLTKLYRDNLVSAIKVNPDNIRPVSRNYSERPFPRKFVRFINGYLRGHPHDWPEEDGRSRSILDFGCHDGTKLIYWYQRGWQVYGIDINEKAIAVARRCFPDGQFWSGDLLELDIKQRFDFVRTDNVIEHLIDPAAYLKALVRLLKPGGQMRVFVPNGTALSARLFGRYSAVYWIPFHLNLFTGTTMKRLLSQLDLHDIVSFTFTPIGAWTWTQRQLLLRPGFNRRPPSSLDRMIRLLSIFNYPGETLSQLFGMGEELITTARRSL